MLCIYDGCLAKRYFLRFLIRGYAEDLIFEVRRSESERIERNFDRADGPLDSFLWFSAVDGHDVAINPAYIQGVRFLWDAAKGVEDSKADESPLRIYLRDRAAPLEEMTDEPSSLVDFFTVLEHGPGVVAFPGFIDEDGEVFQLNAAEIVWVSASSLEIAEGRQQQQLTDAN